MYAREGSSVQVVEEVETPESRQQSQIETPHGLLLELSPVGDSQCLDDIVSPGKTVVVKVQTLQAILSMLGGRVPLFDSLFLVAGQALRNGSAGLLGGPFVAHGCVDAMDTGEREYQEAGKTTCVTTSLSRGLRRDAVVAPFIDTWKQHALVLFARGKALGWPLEPRIQRLQREVWASGVCGEGMEMIRRGARDEVFGVRRITAELTCRE